MDLPLIPGSLPVGWCPASEQDRYNKYFALGIAQLSLGTGYTIKYSDTQPTPEERANTLWYKTIGGVPDRLYVYYNGYWSAQHEAPADGEERRLWVGSEANVWAYDGGDGTDPGAGGANVTAQTGAMFVSCDPRDIAALDREMAELKRKLEQHLIAGPTEITQIRNQIMAQRNALERQVNDAFQAMAQAEADMNAAKS